MTRIITTIMNRPPRRPAPMAGRASRLESAIASPRAVRSAPSRPVVLIEPRFPPTRSGRYRFPCGGAIGTGTLPGPSAFHRSSTIPRSRAPVHALSLSAPPEASGACWARQAVKCSLRRAAVDHEEDGRKDPAAERVPSVLSSTRRRGCWPRVAGGCPGGSTGAHGETRRSDEGREQTTGPVAASDRLAGQPGEDDPAGGGREPHRIGEAVGGAPRP